MVSASRTDRLPLDLCPLCHKADAVAKMTSRSGGEIDMSVTIVLPMRLCGRCLIQLSDAALAAVDAKLGEMR